MNCIKIQKYFKVSRTGANDHDLCSMCTNDYNVHKSEVYPPPCCLKKSVFVVHFSFEDWMFINSVLLSKVSYS